LIQQKRNSEVNRRHFLAGAGGVASVSFLPSAVGAAAAKPLPMPSADLWNPLAGKAHEAEATGPNGAVYYRSYGNGGRTPIIVLHGGPAAGHTYMRPYAALATDREVVLYDQSGCGRSARPTDLKSYSVERYVAELEMLRTHLGYGKVILLGHSWGGMLAMAYAQEHADRVAGLVLAGTAPVLSDFAEAATRWMTSMGPEAMAIAQRAETTGALSDPAYVELMDRYYHEHLCRLDPWPEWLNKVLEELSGNPAYAYLNGPSELNFNGALKTLDLRPGLKHIAVPTLVTCGEFDEAPPWVARKLAAAIPGAKLQSFDGLSHLSHIEDPARVVKATQKFLRNVGTG
jgi:proline-specific peptidase